jgi:hypothetical protein
MLTHRQPEIDKQKGIQADTRQTSAKGRQSCTLAGRQARDGETLAGKQPDRQAGRQARDGQTQPGRQAGRKAGKNRICSLKQFRTELSFGYVLIKRTPFGYKNNYFSCQESTIQGSTFRNAAYLKVPDTPQWRPEGWGRF